MVHSAGIAFTLLEMESWELGAEHQLGNWSTPNIFDFLLSAYEVFMGWGSPIVATLGRLKKFNFHGLAWHNSRILCEVDAGLYGLGAGEKKATFILRNDIGLIYYSGDTFGLLLPKSK